MDLVRNEKHFSLIKITPAHLEVLSQQLKPEEAVGCAGAFIIGGEALWGENLAFWCNNAPSTRLINEYGPTETVVGCCVYEVPSGSTPSGAVPIGRPIANTQVYILDAYRNPVPIGVVGEIYIGGDGVARGYLNRPELTNEKFIANPFSADVTSRLYKTGDLARYLPDGNIEFLGRMDNQVKIRGYRIELGEIEAVLGQHRAIREAVVLAREESPGDQRLVAYIVAAPNSTTSTNELRTFLQQKLPEYMIPSVWVSLDRLPLTLNGKIDRGALPAADQSRLESEKSHEAPRTSVEVAVANVWREVLKIDKVSIRDNFFDLGGHSLLATQIVSRIRDRLSAELPLRAIFESPTVAELATLIEKNQSGSLDEAALTRSLGEIEAMTEEEAQQNLLGT
jgi:acyl-coenzyme A synthetase/AMP-(fatty) acid ligase/acyl carrier protein